MSEDKKTKADKWLGMEMRQLRKGRNLSLEDVAQSAGVSVGLVSQVERGITSPSIRSLRALAEALDIPVTWFFLNGDPPPERELGTIVHPPNRRILTLRHKGVVKELLTPDLLGKLQLLMIYMDPDGSTGPEANSHHGEECGLVLAGNINLHLGDELFPLEEGDSFRFDSTRPHYIHNTHSTPARVLWIATPPVY